MANEPPKRVARIDRGELMEVSPDATPRERGRHLRLLLLGKGIDPHRLYRVEYYPHRHCWLVIQPVKPGQRPESAALTEDAKADEVFYAQAIPEFQRTARAACAALAARSAHFARFGCEYQLPAPAEEISPADLVELLGGPSPDDPAARFDSEGRWWSEPR